MNGEAFRKSGLSEWVGDASPPLFPALECSSSQLRKEPAGGAEPAHVGKLCRKGTFCRGEAGLEPETARWLRGVWVPPDPPSPPSPPPGKAAAAGAGAGDEAAWGHHVPTSGFCPLDSGLGGEHGARGMLGRCGDGTRWG